MMGDVNYEYGCYSHNYTINILCISWYRMYLDTII